MFVDSDVEFDVERLDFGERNSPSIAFDWWFAAIPVLEVRGRKLVFQPLCCHALIVNFGLLHAENGRLSLLKEFLDSALLEHSSYSINVPGPQLKFSHVNARVLSLRCDWRLRLSDYRSHFVVRLVISWLILLSEYSLRRIARLSVHSLCARHAVDLVRVALHRVMCECC